ncbi:MAG: LytTR family DNA-binding domain-containing protein [Flavobacteriaceae bacterium]
MKSKKLLTLPFITAIVLAILIYWREHELRDLIPIYKVLLWQLGIWLPWILGFVVLERFMAKLKKNNYLGLKLFGFCFLLVALHYGWFFWLSSNWSPYLGQEGSRFGVFRYFFVFWTLIDVGLVWFVTDKLKWASIKREPTPILLELTRGKNKYFCEPAQIHLLASENYYTKLFTTEGIFVMRKPLKYFQGILPEDIFKKIHRSTIINVNEVSELVRGEDHKLEVIMKDGTRRRVSRNFVREITLFFKDRTS